MIQTLSFNCSFSHMNRKDGVCHLQVDSCITSRSVVVTLERKAVIKYMEIRVSNHSISCNMASSHL